jgi:hypothetical protein
LGVALLPVPVGDPVGEVAAGVAEHDAETAPGEALGQGAGVHEALGLAAGDIEGLGVPELAGPQLDDPAA